MNNMYIKGKKYPDKVVKKAGKMAVGEGEEPLIKVTFPFTHADVAAVKLIERRRYIDKGSEKYWTVPMTISSILALKNAGFTLDETLQKMLNEYAAIQIDSPKKVQVDIYPYKKINIPGLKGKLMPFQETGVRFIEDKNGRALLADEMGLGKTIQAIGWLQLHPELRPAVVICPAALKWNWAKEMQKWMPHPKVQVLSGTDSSVPIIGEIIVINYDITAKLEPILQELHAKVLIVDECHYLKNSKAKRTVSVLGVAKAIPYRIIISGTPIINRPVEFFNGISLVNPNLFNFWKFAQRYCNAKRNGFGWDFNGASNTQELYNILTQTVMIRRLKKDVYKDLPDKMYSFIPLELENRKEYDYAKDNFIDWVTGKKGEEYAEKASFAETLVQIESLKKLAVQGKFHQAVEWINVFLESGKKLVIFTSHTFAIDALQDIYGEVAVKLDGSTSPKDRQKVVDEFQTNPNIKLFLGNIKAAGVGITLTASSDVAFLELPWTPGELLQAEDRCHRIGQKETVSIHFLLGVDTIEEEIAKILDEKKQVLSQVLDGKEVDKTTLLGELLKKYKS